MTCHHELSAALSEARDAALTRWSGGGAGRGWLQKPDFKEPSKLERWIEHRGDVAYKARFFVVEDAGLPGARLDYYASAPDPSARKAAKPKGSLPLAGVVAVRISAAPEAPGPAPFDVVTGTHVFTLVAASHDERLFWVASLQRALPAVS